MIRLTSASCGAAGGPRIATASTSDIEPGPSTIRPSRGEPSDGHHWESSAAGRSGGGGASDAAAARSAWASASWTGAQAATIARRCEGGDEMWVLTRVREGSRSDPYLQAHGGRQTRLLGGEGAGCSDGEKRRRHSANGCGIARAIPGTQGRSRKTSPEEIERQ